MLKSLVISEIFSDFSVESSFQDELGGGYLPSSF